MKACLDGGECGKSHQNIERMFGLGEGGHSNKRNWHAPWGIHEDKYSLYALVGKVHEDLNPETAEQY